MRAAPTRVARPRRPEGAAGPVLAAAGAAMLLSWVPLLRPLLFPFRLLLTLVHELSHGLAALATGGRFLSFVVNADGSGLATTAGGWRLAIVPAGYLGAAAFGAGLIVLGGNRRAVRWTLGLLGAALGLLSMRYGVPSLVRGQLAGGALAVVTGCAFALALGALAVKAADRWVVFTVYLLAFSTGLAALSDLWTLIGLSGLGAGSATDARSMAEIAWMPPIFWALLWALTGVGLVAGAAAWAWRRL